MAFITALPSLKGGVGRTTLVANLVSLLVQRGRHAVAVDFDPQNGLYHHFAIEPGMVPSVCDLGWSPPRTATALGRVSEAPCVPFGFRDRRQAETLLAERPEWLKQRLKELLPAHCDVVVVDTPAYPSLWTRRALQLADLVVGVITPDPAAFASLPASEAFFDEISFERMSGAETQWLVNRFDGTSSLAHDVLAAIRGALGQRVLPNIVHEDRALGEALARRQCLVDGSGDSQVLADLGVVADWILARSARKNNAPTNTRVSTKL